MSRGAMQIRQQVDRNFCHDTVSNHAAPSYLDVLDGLGLAADDLGVGVRRVARAPVHALETGRERGLEPEAMKWYAGGRRPLPRSPPAAPGWP